MQVTDDNVSGTKRQPKTPPSAQTPPQQEEDGVDALIDQNLRKVYDDLVEDEVPDRFRSLLDQLRRQEGGK